MPSVPAAVWRARPVRESAVLLAFCLLTALMTWPWVRHLRGAVADAGDPYMIAWALWWDYHQTFNDPLNLFHANVFYPYRYTLAFSEHDYGISLLFFPLFALGVRPLTVHSVATFLGFAFCGYGAFRLARTLSGSRGAAWVAGFVYAFIPFRFHSLSHLHYLFAGWIPLLLEALVLFARERSRRRAAWLGAAFLMNGLTCVTWMVLTLAPLALTVALLLARDPRLGRDRDFWLRGGAAVGFAALLLLPFLLPYYYVSSLYGLKWEDWEFAANSPGPGHWLAAGPRAKLWAGLDGHVPGGDRLFPGLLPPLLALAALGVRGAGGRVGAVGVGVVWAVWGFLASLGANFFLNTLMHEYLLPYRSVRVPSRSAMVCYVGLSVLAGVGAAGLARLASRARPRAYAAVLVVVLAGLTLDLRAFPLGLERGEVYPDAVTLRLKETPMRGGLVELPSDECCSRHRYMLRAADHGRPLVNATASFRSPLADDINRLSAASPITDELLELLERVPASYLVVHNASVPTPRRPDYATFLARAVAAGRLRFVNRFDGRDDLYAVVKTEPDARAEASPPAELELRDWAALAREDPAGLLVEQGAWGQALYRLRLVGHGRMPRYEEFMRDAAEVGRGLFPGADGSRQLFEERLRGAARESAGAQGDALGDDEYVARLYANAGLEPDPAERAALVRMLASGSETRAGVLVKVAADPRLVERERWRSLLLLHYFAFLRRDPDDPPDRDLTGFDFWLGKLERERDPDKLALAFGESLEYKGRWGGRR
ncbi:MAG TPA: hypothetical protein VN282_19335 [Pyrinomonadaceae bacterium]|nr:hypothetical protein [Pyrinomonadaceae bacterium]